MNFITINNYRISKIMENVYHIEKSFNGAFNDKNTLFIPNKRNFLDLKFNYAIDINEVIINDFESKIKIDINNEKVTIYTKNTAELTYFLKNVNNGELPKPIETPLFYAVYDNPRIILKEEGYVKNDEEYITQEEVLDVYLIFANREHKLLRKTYVELTGRNELVRLSTLGSWDSRYYPYHDKEALDIIDTFKKHNLPLDNFVIDTDWRKASDRGIGYEINTKLFPNMKDFFNEAHKRDVEIIFNDHPEPVEGALSALDNLEIEYRKTNLTHLLSLGLDSWWYDRNWITSLKSPSKNIPLETIGLYLFHDVTKKYYENIAIDQKYARRPVLMGNIVNVSNGRYLGIKDTASHRYSLQWSGDINSGMMDLGQEVSNLVKASNSLIAFYSSDIGGHIGNPNKEEYIRWIEFGAFEPIFRPHCTISVTKYREPWLYDEETVEIYRRYALMRYHLLPYVYAGAYLTYRDGNPFYKGLGFNYPSDRKANDEEYEYMINDGILVAPYCLNKSSDFNKDNYCKKVHAKFFNNKKLEGEPVLEKEYDEIDFELLNEKIENEVSMYDFSAIFTCSWQFKEDKNVAIRVDDGARVYIDGQLIYDDWSDKAATEKYLGLFKKDKIYDVRVEYYQAGGGAELRFKEFEPYLSDSKEIYLPDDEWFDLVYGKIEHQTSKIVKYDRDELPLFVRCGSIIPLINHALSTKRQDWSKIMLDVYPSKLNSSSFIIYEDDHETVAYKYGEFRITPYSFRYDNSKKTYLINIEKAKGKFKNSEDILSRDIIIKLENIFNDRIKEVRINDEIVDFEINKKDLNSTSFDFKKSSRLNETITICFKEDLEKAYEIEIDIF